MEQLKVKMLFYRLPLISLIMISVILSAACTKGTIVLLEENFQSPEGGIPENWRLYWHGNRGAEQGVAEIGSWEEHPAGPSAGWRMERRDGSHGNAQILYQGEGSNFANFQGQVIMQANDAHHLGVVLRVQEGGRRYGDTEGYFIGVKPRETQKFMIARGAEGHTVDNLGEFLAVQDENLDIAENTPMKLRFAIHENTIRARLYQWNNTTDDFVLLAQLTATDEEETYRSGLVGLRAGHGSDARYGQFANLSITTASGSRVHRNPYQTVNWEAVNQYIANFHCHTVLSDGRAEPDVQIHNYANAGYHILAIADHDNYHTVREGERETEPTAETTWPWTDFIDEKPSEIWEHNGMETSAFYPELGEKGMLAIRANELTTDPHIVSLFNDCGWLERGEQCDDERLECVEKKNGLAYYAHPVDYVTGGRWAGRVFEPTWEAAVEYFGYFINKYDSCLGIEMQLRRRLELEEVLLDRLLQEYYRDHNIFIKGSDDSHSTRVGSNATMTIVLAEDLTEEAVRHALEHGHNFVGSRSDEYPSFNRIYVDRERQMIVLDVDNYDRIRWIRDGNYHGTGKSMSFAQMNNTVVRFELDLGEATFYSQAFYILSDR